MGNVRPTRKLQNQFTMQATDMAVATYLESNISATMSHGIGPRPISKKDTYDMTANKATIFGTEPI